MLCRNLGCDVLGLGVKEAPTLIDLYPLTIQIPHYAVLIFGARRASINRHFYHRVDGDASHTARGPQRVSFDQRRDDLRAASGIQAVHTDYYA
jgi:hypothetical protein